jgi:hypothetical protein
MTFLLAVSKATAIFVLSASLVTASVSHFLTNSWKHHDSWNHYEMFLGKLVIIKCSEARFLDPTPGVGGTVGNTAGILTNNNGCDNSYDDAGIGLLWLLPLWVYWDGLCRDSAILCGRNYACNAMCSHGNVPNLHQHCHVRDNAHHTVRNWHSKLHGDRNNRLHIRGVSMSPQQLLLDSSLHYLSIHLK